NCRVGGHRARTIPQSLTKSMFLTSPEYLVRFTADFLNSFPNTSAVSSSQSPLDMESSSGLGLNRGSLWGLEKRFQGQTSWQTSQPKIQSSILPWNSPGISFLSSMVR